MHEQPTAAPERIGGTTAGTHAGNRAAAREAYRQPARPATGFAHLLAEAERVHDRVELTPPAAPGLGWRLHAAAQSAAAFVQTHLRTPRGRDTAAPARAR